MRYRIRRAIVNATAAKWGLIDQFCEDGILTISVEEAADAIGLFSILSALANEEELEFIKELYTLFRSKEADSGDTCA